MACSTRVSTRSMLSPVRDRLGMTKGSKRTRHSEGESQRGGSRLVVPEELEKRVAAAPDLVLHLCAEDKRVCTEARLEGDGAVHRVRIDLQG